MATISLNQAIIAINPDAKVTVINDSLDRITWHDNTPVISNEDILAKQTELEADYITNEYQRDRANTYPRIREFLEAYTEKEIGEDSTKWDAYVVKYNKVRSDIPKP